MPFSKKKYLKIVAVAMVLTLPASAFATGWVDEWVAQKSSTSGSHFEGQKRGYYSGGSFNARFPNGNDYPVTVEVPRVKGGCGGIDMFAGGLSFLDFQYLVEKLQKIMMNAGAVAFDLALNTLCEPCSTAIKGFESIANQLNGLQLNDCTAGKEVVAKVKDFASNPDESGKKLGEAVERFDLGQGISDLWNKVKTDTASAGGKVTKEKTESLVSGCSADFKALLGDKGLMLDNVGVGKLGLSQAYVDLIRGMVGDIKIESSEKNYSVSYVSPCPENIKDDVSNFTIGKTFAKDADGNCAVIADTNANINSYVQKEIIKITAKMKAKQSLSAGSVEEKFIQNSPLSLGLLLKNAIATGRENSILSQIGDITTRAYALGMMSDLLERCQFIASKVEEVIIKKGTAIGSAEPETCNPDIFGDGVADQIRHMTERIYRQQSLAKQSYAAAITEHMTILNLLGQIQSTDQMLFKNLSKRYGSGLAKRVIN
ncbi:MAG: hypothetical protein A2511_09970 [Deltaproteobacteria bacterium RIFOXYD12_FULL_50_9]|nr:MAG: hypothetical protein A2511_09970 [Deltaproteobacteria bacterium RIFOXYD12_FULL_50_9]